MRLRIWTVICLVCAASAAPAQDCFRKVVEFSEGICAEFVRLDGDERAMNLRGDLNAELTGIFKSITDIGGEFGGSLDQEEYTNILREDIPAALESGRQCRLEVARAFFDKICGGETGAVDSRFAQAAHIVDPDGWTNVRSGAGTQFAIVERIYVGETFFTHRQPEAWWQVRTPSGRVGYVHRSRIVLGAR